MCKHVQRGACHWKLPPHTRFQSAGQWARPSGTSHIHTRAHPGAVGCVRAQTSPAVFRLCSVRVPASDSTLCHLELQCQRVRSKNTAALLWTQISFKTLCSRTTFYRPFQVLVLAEGHMKFYRQVFCIARISKRKNGEKYRLITSKLYMFKHSSYFLQFKRYLYEQAWELLKGELFGSNHRSITLMLKKNLYWNLSYLCKEMDLIT